MKTPQPIGIPKHFNFSKSTITKYSLPAIFLGFKIEKWNAFEELAREHLALKQSLTATASKQKWINDLKNIKNRYTRRPDVSRFAKNLAQYLETDGDKSYCTTYDSEKDKLEAEEIKRKQNLVSSRTRKKIRLLEALEVEKEVDQELAACSELSSKQAVDNNNKSISVKKTIFSDGKKLHERYAASQRLNPFERKRMSSGLSGILDIGNHNKGQQTLFKKEDWDKMTNYYTHKYKLPTVPTSNNLEEKWNYIFSKCVLSNSAFAGRQYIDKLCSVKDINIVDYKTYKLLDCILEMIDDTQHILNPSDVNSLTEGDYTYQVWLPLFKRLFAIGDSGIRLKTGESVSEDSTNEKWQIYSDNFSSIIGFKVDIRFLHNYDDQEYDLCNMEVCLPNEDDQKVQGDKGKLAREGKLNTSSIYQVVDDKSSARSWVIQASGLCATFSTVVYASNNLFVLVPQFKISYPTCIGHLKNFFADIDKLFTFREEIIKLAVNIEAKLEDERNKKNADALYHDICSNYLPPCSPPSSPATPSIVNWYTPPRNEVSKSVIPMINEIFLNEASDTEFESEDDRNGKHNEGDDDEEDNNEEDDDDFVLTKKGWYCKITKQYLKYHPYKSSNIN